MRYATAFLIMVSAASAIAQETKPTEGYLPEFSRVAPRAKKELVPLQVSFPASAKLESYPVTFGVPFPRGALRSEENVRFLEDGREIPAAVRKTATWDRPDGDVKWLLVDSAVRPGPRYSLEFGTEAAPRHIVSDLHLTDEKDAVSVDTGPLRFVISRSCPGIIYSASLGNRAPMVPPGASPPPFMTDDKGTRFDLSADGYKVTVEQSGPLHAVIKVEGWYQSAEGRKLCQFIARVHAYSGQSFIRIEHTFVVAFDTDATRLRDIAIPFKLDAGAQSRATFGLDGEATRELNGPAYLVQDSADHFTLKSGDGAESASGKRAAGWADLSGAQGGLTIGLRNMWQEHPRELEVKDGAIIAHLWPAHLDRPLDFDARAVLGPELYREWGDRVYWQNWYKGGLDQYDQAYGLAKSNDLLLVFHGPNLGTAPAVCRMLDEPVIVSPTPEWMCRTDVMGPIHPCDPKRFPDVERKMNAGFTRFEWQRAHLGNYGLINFGDVNYNLDLDKEKKLWRPHPWRRWASRFYGHPVMPWVEFLRTGDRRYFQWGDDNARHVMDVDMCHLTNEKVGSYKYPKYRGGRYGGNGGIIHYGADIYDIGCDSHVDHLLLQYYLTGYRRAWDVLQEEAEFYLWKDTRPGGSLHAWGHRMTGGALRTMTALYQATWDERYLKLAQRMADFCYQNHDDGGVIRFDDVYMAPGMFTYYQATGDARMKDLFLRCMRYQAKAGRNESDPRSFGFYGLSMAYFMTGDPAFLPWAERWKQDFVQCVTEGDDPFWYGKPKDQWDYCYLTLHLLYMPYYLEALSTLDKPVQPIVRGNAITSGEIVLRRDDNKPFRVAAEWSCYDSRYSTGVRIPGLDRYLARRPPTARVVLWGPGGAEVAATPIVMTPEKATGKAATDSPELRRAPVTERRSGTVAFDVPAGPPGVYRMGIEGTGDLPFKLRLASSDLTKVGYTTSNEYLACADAYYFYVPPDAQTFELSFKTLALRRQVEFTVYDPSGGMRRDEMVVFAATPAAAYTTWPFIAAPEHRGKLWRFAVSPAVPQVERTYLRFTNLPGMVWTNPETFFAPDDEALRPRKPPEPVAEPYPGAGGGTRIEPGKPLVIPRGEAQGEGRYKNLDPRQGTLEFWFRPEWAPDDLSDHTIASCGKLRLYRRSQLGTYVGLAGTVQSGFTTEAGRWYHLAVTWDAGAPGRPPQTRLFINGLDLTGDVLSPPAEPLGDWTGEDLIIGGDIAFTVNDMRLSDVVRYKGDFDIPSTPPLSKGVP